MHCCNNFEIANVITSLLTAWLVSALLCFPVFINAQLLIIDSNGNDNCSTIFADESKILLGCAVKGSFLHHGEQQNPGNLSGLLLSFEMIDNEQLSSANSRFLPSSEDIELQAVMSLSDSMFLVGGRFFGELDWDGHYANAGSGQSALFMAKVNNDLQVKQLVKVEGNGFKRLTSLATDNSSLYASVYFNGDILFEDLLLTSADSFSSSFILKLDQSMGMLGGMLLAGTNTLQINSMYGMDSSLLVAGTYKGQFSIGTDTLISLTSHSNVFLLGLDSLFSPMWLRGFNGVFDDSAVKIVGEGEHYFILGNYSGVLRFNDSTTIESTDFFNDTWLASFSFPDHLNWVTTFNGQQQVNGTHLRSTGDKLWIAGQYLFEVLSGTHKIDISNNAQMPAYLAMLDPENGYVHTLVSTTGNGIHAVFSMEVLAERICMAGAYSGVLDHAGIPYPVSQIAGFLLCDDIDNMYTSILRQQGNVDFAIYPQPASRHLSITSPYTGLIDYSLYSVKGIELCSGSGWLDNSLYQIELPDLSTGVYILQIRTEAAVLSRLVIIVHSKN